MDIKQAIAASLTQTDFIVDGYLADLTPDELLARPVPNANHIAWQLGHLIASDAFMLDKAVPGKLRPLPAGFAEKHDKTTAASDNRADFLSKEEYLRLKKDVREQTLQIVRDLPAADFDRPVSGLPPMVKTVGEVFLFVATHWLMHVGQWAIVRRKLGRKPLY